MKNVLNNKDLLWNWLSQNPSINMKDVSDNKDWNWSWLSDNKGIFDPTLRKIKKKVILKWYRRRKNVKISTIMKKLYSKSLILLTLEYL